VQYSYPSFVSVLFSICYGTYSNFLVYLYLDSFGLNVICKTQNWPIYNAATSILLLSFWDCGYSLLYLELVVPVNYKGKLQLEKRCSAHLYVRNHWEGWYQRNYNIIYGESESMHALWLLWLEKTHNLSWVIATLNKTYRITPIKIMLKNSFN